MLPLPRQPESVCILRLSALGDATHVVPVVRAIQDHWPETRITWIVGKLEHRLLAGLDGVEFIEQLLGREVGAAHMGVDPELHALGLHLAHTALYHLLGQLEVRDAIA